MKIWHIGLLGLAWLLAGCSGIDSDRPGEDPVKVGSAVPTFSVTLQDGNVLSSKDLEGQISVIVFFHTTCSDCQRVLPLVQRVYEEYKPAGVRFVCIARAQGAAEIQAFWQMNRLTLPWSAQEDRSVYSLFAASRIPRVYVVDRRGVIRSVYSDNPTPTYEALCNSLDALLPGSFEPFQ